MIHLVRVPISSSIQDAGRIGVRHLGLSRSGAMDLLSMRVANLIAGSSADAAVIELGAGPCEIDVTTAGAICFGGAKRGGAPWWKRLEVNRGDHFSLTATLEGVWSYIAIEGGADAPIHYGSKSVQVREGIGRWLRRGDTVEAGRQLGTPRDIDPPPMRGPVRIFGELPGDWRVSMDIDRMGYRLDGEPVEGGASGEISEPVSVGSIQLPPSGLPIVLMAEGPTVGGYSNPAIVHSEDLRLVAQVPPGASISFVTI